MIITVREAVNRAAGDLAKAGVVSTRLEAEILLSRATGWPRPVILIHDEKPIPAQALERFNELVSRRCRREPLQQILGETEFFGLKILVDKNVMAPRPETEVLVEQVIKRWRPGYGKILDIGTGSGCIAVALAKNIPECSVDAIDISEKALGTAGRNIALYSLEDRINLIRGDLFPANGAAYDVIVSNPPYIPSKEIESLMPEVSCYEPRMALDGGDDGLLFYRRIAGGLKGRLNSPGLVVLEAGDGQADLVSEILFRVLGNAKMEIVLDLSGIKRIVVVEV